MYAQQKRLSYSDLSHATCCNMHTSIIVRGGEVKSLWHARQEICSTSRTVKTTDGCACSAGQKILAAAAPFDGSISLITLPSCSGPGDSQLFSSRSFEPVDFHLQSSLSSSAPESVGGSTCGSYSCCDPQTRLHVWNAFCHSP